jgi:hypothetical protein
MAYKNVLHEIQVMLYSIIINILNVYVCVYILSLKSVISLYSLISAF